MSAALSPEGREARHARLLGALQALRPPVQLRLHRNRSVLVSLRGRRTQEVLGIHEDLLDHEACLSVLPRWVERGGRGRFPELIHAMRAVAARSSEARALAAAAQLPPLESLRGPLDLKQCFDRIYQAWFAHLPCPRVAWARRSLRALSHIRFGCYRRRPLPLIQLHPRLDQPWVARVFVDHVLFHELCHHAQACAPVRGEPPHSPRFRSWERRFPHHDLALAWERVHLRHLLDGTKPTQH